MSVSSKKSDGNSYVVSARIYLRCSHVVRILFIATRNVFCLANVLLFCEKVGWYAWDEEKEVGRWTEAPEEIVQRILRQRRFRCFVLS